MKTSFERYIRVFLMLSRERERDRGKKLKPKITEIDIPLQFYTSFFLLLSTKNCNSIIPVYLCYTQ